MKVRYGNEMRVQTPTCFCVDVLAMMLPEQRLHSAGSEQPEHLSFSWCRGAALASSAMLLPSTAWLRNRYAAMINYS